MRLAAFSTWPIQGKNVYALYESLERNEIPHAVLFVGSPDATEKLSVHIMKTILCKGAESPCGVCPSCIQFDALSNPDIYRIDGVTNGSVKTAEIEALQDQLKLRAHGGRVAYLIHGIDSATPVAANRLLKTIEEPEPNVFAFFTARNERKVLPTVLSRCFIYRLEASREDSVWDDPVSVRTGAILENETEFAELLQKMVEWAEGMLKHTDAPLIQADTFLQFTSAIELSDALQVLSIWLRDVLHWQLGNFECIRFSLRRESLQRQSQLATAASLSEAVQLVLDTRLRLQAHVVPSLNIEQMCIRLWGVVAHV